MLQEWCGLVQCPAYLQRALCHVIRMQQQGDEEAITLDDIILAKVGSRNQRLNLSYILSMTPCHILQLLSRTLT